MVIVPQHPQHRAAADGAERRHPHGDAAPAQALRDEIRLCGQLLLLPVLRGRAVQQQVHGQLSRLLRRPAGEHPLVPQRPGAPGQLRPQPPGAARTALVLRPQQQRVLQLLRQLCDGQLVFHQMLLIIRPVLLPLLPEVGRVPGRLRRGRAAHRFAAGKVQPAVLVHAGAQGALRLTELPRRQHGRAEAVLHIPPQDRLRRPALQKAEQRLLLQTAAAAGRVV